MKKIKTILMILTLLFCSYGISNINAKDKVNLYLFYGEGCPHCEEFMEYLDGMEEEYKAKFNLVKYEVWYDEDNSNLMNSVASALGDEVSGVPYFVIGDKSFSGYSEASNDDIKSAIDKALTSNYDVMDKVDGGKDVSKNSTSKSNNVVVYLSIAIIVIGIAGLLIYTKKSVK